MFKRSQFTISLACLLWVCGAQYATAQPLADSSAQPLTVTAACSSEFVRFTAPAKVYELRLEVFATDGQTLYDSGFKFGNVLDWGLHDQQGQHLTDGAYHCVITVRGLFAGFSRKQGTVLLQAGQPALQAAHSPQAIRSANSLLAINSANFLMLPGKERELPLTTLAHDGRQGWLVSGLGGLSFRTGDFFTGKDVERMRLTGEGNLGIGTENPQAKLDVAGLIRTSEGLVFPDGSVQTTAFNGNQPWTGKQGTLTKDGKPAVASAPEQTVTGSGTPNYIPKWTGSTTLGNSALIDVGGNLGLGTSTPAALLSRRILNANTNTVVEIGRHERVTGSVGAAGIGLKDTYYVPNGNGNLALAGEMTWGLHGVTNGQEYGRWSVGVPVFGTVREIFETDPAGRAVLSRWGTNLAGAFTQATMTVALRDTTTGTMNNSGPRLMMKVENSDLSIAKFLGSLGAVYWQATDSADLIFTARASSSDPSAWTERIRIVGTTGNVGIGVTAPTTRLHVVNDTGGGHAIFGYATGGYGVFGQATGAGYGIVGTNLDLTNGTAGQFNGHVNVSNNLNVSGSKNFRIDHPLDPANKYLYHASIESSEVKNLYDGTVMLDQHGEAVVQLPPWFEVLNRDFRYQLTCIGGHAPVYIAEEIANQQFKIAGGQAGMKVSWQVTGNRQDPMAKTHPMQVEQVKPERERGYYLHPELYGQPEEKGVEWTRNPEMMRQLKQQREKAQAEKEKKSN